MRSALTEFMYCLCGGDRSVDITPALAISEMNSINAYLDNIILDNKNRIWEGEDTREKISGATIASGLFRELIEKIILNMETSDMNKLRILRSLSECMAKSYQGQQLDIEIGVDRIDDFATDEAYLKWYEMKSKLQSGFLYGFSSKVGAVLAGVKDEQILVAEKFGQIFGTGLHISNDLGDFAVFLETTHGTGFKQYEDQMADAKNGRLTFPMYHILKYGTPSEKQTLWTVVDNHSASYEELISVSKAIHTSGAFQFGRNLIRSYFNESKRLLHKNFPKNEDRDMLSSMLGAIISNKYLNLLKQADPALSAGSLLLEE